MTWLVRVDGDVVSRHDDRSAAVDVLREEAVEAGYARDEVESAIEEADEPRLYDEPEILVEEAPDV